MGLQNTAHYLQSKGRGNDTMLVHMTPREVKGLQDLALAAGGSLTINPDTGLPEAGFLEQMLPVVAAAGLTYLTAGAAAPTLTAALGGSAMAGGIAAGALSGAAISGGMAAMQGKNVEQAALMGGLGGGVSGGLGAYDAANVFNAPNLLADASQQAATTAGTQAVTQAGTQAAGAAPSIGDFAGSASDPTAGMVQAANTGLPPGPTLGSAPPSPAELAKQNLVGESYAVPRDPTAGYAGTEQGIVNPAVMPQTPTPTPSPTYYSGLGSGTMDTVKKAAIQGLPAVAGAMGSETYDQQQFNPQDPYNSRLRRISPDFRAYEPPRPNPYYSAQYPTYAAEGGIMQSYQAGGPVERMSQMNTAMNPQGGLYPMGMIDKTQYATPIQRPVSSEMVMNDSAYERSSPMLMAEGGQVKGYAAGGMPDFGNGRTFPNLPPMSGPLGAIGQPPAGGFNPFSPERMTALRNDPKFLEMQRVQGGGRDEQGRTVDGLGNVLERTAPSEQSFGQIMGGLQNMLAQPTGQSMFPGAASMQGGFGQGAQGYPSFAMGSGDFGGGGGPFPLEGQYGIVKMNTGGPTKLPKGDPGIYTDTNPTTRGQDAFTAALTRLNSAQKRANIKGLPVLKAAAEPLGNVETAARGGIMSSLGGYSDGGRMLKGPGDGMSDSIPASIGNKQPARLADGEFVVPADVVSHLGNGSTDAGARKLYSMMDKIRKARTGKKKQAPAVKADRYMPA